MITDDLKVKAIVRLIDRGRVTLEDVKNEEYRKKVREIIEDRNNENN